MLAVAAACWARRALVLVTVAGESMLPALRPGDRVLVRRTRRLRPGQVVVLAYGPEWLVKRIAAVSPGHVVVLGDNAGSSVDSRSFGAVPVGSVLGVEVRRFRSPAGARRS